jgi:hypothetical protein
MLGALRKAEVAKTGPASATRSRRRAMFSSACGRRAAAVECGADRGQHGPIQRLLADAAAGAGLPRRFGINRGVVDRHHEHRQIAMTGANFPHEIETEPLLEGKIGDDERRTGGGDRVERLLCGCCLGTDEGRQLAGRRIFLARRRAAAPRSRDRPPAAPSRRRPSFRARPAQMRSGRTGPVGCARQGRATRAPSRPRPFTGFGRRRSPKSRSGSRRYE